MRNTVFQSNDWKVFLEGVEIPFISISVNAGKNGELYGSVEVQASILLVALSPYAALAVFFRDRESSNKAQQSQSIEQEYVLFAEGSVSQISTDKSADQRNVTLKFRGHLDTLNKHKKGYISRMSDDAAADISSGTLIPSAEAGERTPISDYLGYLIPSDMAQFKLGSINNRTDSAVSVLVHSLISFFLASNASCKNEANRTRLLNKFAVMTDASFKTIVDVEALNGLISESESSSSGESSFLSIVTAFLNRFGYSIYATTCPAAAKNSGTGKTELINEEVFKGLRIHPGTISSNLLRNDFLILPETYYLPPPPCNLLFPDSITSLSFTRDFDNEPTRSLMTLRSVAESNTSIIFQSYKSTDDLQESFNAFLGTMLPSSVSDARSKPTVGLDSDFSIEMFDNLNSLSALSDDELTRGIILNAVDSGPEFYFAAARTWADPQEGEPVEESVLPSLLKIGKTAASATSVPSAGGARRQDLLTEFITSVEGVVQQRGRAALDEKILNYNQQYLKFRHTLDMFRRELTVVCRGLRWSVPGFSCVVFDKDACYIGKLERTETSISAAGDERTVIQLSQVRELAPLDYTFDGATVFKFKKVDDLDYYQMPAPPPSAEFSYTSPEKLDKLYQQILGCQKFYSSDEYGKGIKIRDASDSRSAISNYLELLKVLARVFEGARKYAPSDTAFDAVSPSWDQQVQSGENVTSWVERSFHRRSSQTLEGYLNANGFSPVLNSIGPSNGTKFQYMEPVQIKQAQKSKSLRFDNSIICRLVDGRAICGLSPDPLVEERRAQAIKSEFKHVITKQLTSSYRQELIKQYSLRSFGNMSIKG
jgi:hypothetical protein